MYAPEPGVFATDKEIGARAMRGDIVGRIGGIPIRAPVDGHIRGLTHDGALVEAGAKILEIDPRRDNPSWVGIGERPRRVADGVLTALMGTCPSEAEIGP